jgi:hypothetical protein
VLDADDDPPAFFVGSYSEVSPDGHAHYPIVAAKLARMHAEEPLLTREDVHRLTLLHHSPSVVAQMRRDYRVRNVKPTPTASWTSKSQSVLRVSASIRRGLAGVTG